MKDGYTLEGFVLVLGTGFVCLGIYLVEFVDIMLAGLVFSLGICVMIVSFGAGDLPVGEAVDEMSSSRIFHAITILFLFYIYGMYLLPLYEHQREFILGLILVSWFLGSTYGGKRVRRGSSNGG